MKILAFLQNQWFRDPERARRALAYYVEKRGAKGRNRFIADMLFFGCLTGRRLRLAFGEDACSEIVWEEASPELHGKASAAPPANVGHMLAAFRQHQPDVVLLFGRIARDGWMGMSRGGEKKCVAIELPHPAARHATVMEELRTGAETLRRLANPTEDVS